MAAPSVAVREHAGVAGLVAGARRQEPSALFATLFGRGRSLGLGQALRPAVGRDDGGEIGELLRCSARSWLPACVAWSAPVAPWLCPTSADTCARLVSMLPRHRPARAWRPATANRVLPA
jgi:hypothetical protein